MNTISDLKNNSNVEQVANELFDLIKQKDKNISHNLATFDDNIVSKFMSVSQELVNTNFANNILVEKKTQLDSYSKDISKFSQIFTLLDTKVDDEIKNNSSLSQTEKDNLQQEFLFNIRAKRLDLSSADKQCQFTLMSIEQKLNDKNDLNPFSDKLSLLERIKSMKNNVTDDNNILKNKLK